MTRQPNRARAQSISAFALIPCMRMRLRTPSSQAPSPPAVLSVGSPSAERGRVRHGPSPHIAAVASIGSPSGSSVPATIAAVSTATATAAIAVPSTAATIAVPSGTIAVSSSAPRPVTAAAVAAPAVAAAATSVAIGRRAAVAATLTSAVVAAAAAVAAAVALAAAASVHVSCTALRNTGREQHTFAHHVVRHWDALPARLHLVPLPLTGAHHDRLSPLTRGLLDPKHTCQTFADATRRRAATFAERVSHFCGRASCPEERTVSRDAPCTCHLLNYSLDRYRKRNNFTVAAARPRILWRWAEAHLKVSQGALRSLPVCTSGVASTSRAWLRSRPRAVFEAIERETAAAHHGEAGHYMERLMAAAYGPLPTSPLPLPQNSTRVGKRTPRSVE